MTPSELSFMVKRGNFSTEEDKFDAVISIYNLAPLGMGRNLEVINPWADLVTMAQSWCLTKKGGRALVAVPTDKTDRVAFNEYRVYGDLQLPHLFANWDQVFTDDKYQIHKGTP